nr:phage tail tube protein [Gemmata massiliana]
MAVPGLKTVNLPNITVTSIDTTHLGLTSYQKTFMPGMIDNGSISFTCEFSESIFTTLHGMLRDVVDWRVTAPADESVVASFSGFLTSIQQPFEPDAEAVLTAEIKVSGDVSLS